MTMGTSDSPDTLGPRSQGAAKGPAGLYLVFAIAGACSIAAALAMAFGGFTWGLPNSAHIQSYHPDEQNITYSLRNMRPAQHDFNPHFWGNPTFYTYQVGALALAASRAGLLPATMDAEFWLTHPDAVRSFYVLGRELSFVYAIFSTILVFFVARRVTQDKFAPVAAAIVFASLPVTAVHCHYMTVNASAVFWSLAAMLLALRIADKPSWPNYILAGAFAGLAIATKLSNAFLPLGVLTAHLIVSAPGGLRASLRSKKLAASALACAAAFFIGSPYYILAHSHVATDPHNAMNMSALFDFSASPETMLSEFWKHWSAASGWVLGGVFVAIVPLAIVFGPRRRLAPILAVVLPFFALAVKSGEWAFPSRVWPLLALLAVVAAVLVFESRRAFVAGLLAPSVLVGLLFTVPWNLAYLGLARSEHIREQSSAWIEANIHPDSGIIILDTPYYEAPDIVYQNAVHPELVTGPRYDIVNLRGDLAALPTAGGKWLVITQSFERPIRETTGRSIEAFAETSGFDLVTSFDRDFECCGVALRSWVPADMVQDYPVFIFKRRETVLPASPTPGEIAPPAGEGTPGRLDDNP